jgi:hypothetical protein
VSVTKSQPQSLVQSLRLALTLASNVRIRLKDKLQRTGKEESRTYVMILSQCFSGRTDENYNKYLIRIPSLRAENQTRDMQNTKHE